MESEALDLDAFHMNPEDEKTLRQAMRNRDNILVCGPTGSGKTSLLKTLLRECGPEERVAILEDSAEIVPPNAVSFSLRARANRFAAVEGSTWNLDQLVYEALRMRPERIILGECRGPEALGLLHAIQSGHRGVMCTLHASSATQAIERYENLVRLASLEAVQMKSARWDLIVVLTADGPLGRKASLYPQ